MSRSVFSGRRIVIALPLLLAFVVVGLKAQTVDPEAAAQRLKSAGVYAFGGVGFAGRISRGELDYRVILSEPPDQALKVFEDVFAHGNSQGRSYALAGIHKLDPDRFKELYASVAASEDVVVTMRGCIMSRSKLKNVVKGIGGREGGEAR